ncbi:MAG: noncanonical pyrimidine nucleotidase, YjjG family [Clostridiales bacterium]|nr:noncanonical pyrimidine nucleotidase, YjjG family [Clostridiales bacterium]
MKYQVLLSDADGTLFDFKAGERNAIRETFQHFSFPVTEENVLCYHHANDEQWKRLERGETDQTRLRWERFKIFMERAGLTGNPHEISEFYESRLGMQQILLPGALEFCREVSAAMPIYLVTNGLARVQHSRFESSVLAPYIAGLVISEEVGASKPDPAMVFEALKMAGAKPGEAVLLGDSVTADIPAAKKAGVDSIFINHEGNIPEKHGANYAVSTLEAARKIILEK